MSRYHINSDYKSRFLVGIKCLPEFYRIWLPITI